MQTFNRGNLLYYTCEKYETGNKILWKKRLIYFNGILANSDSTYFENGENKFYRLQYNVVGDTNYYIESVGETKRKKTIERIVKTGKKNYVCIRNENGTIRKVKEYGKGLFPMISHYQYKFYK
jgi:hypothetical protein